MIEYTWEILSLYTSPHENGLDNVVKKVNWRFQATDGQYYGDSYETTDLSAPSVDNYIQFDDLEQETIIGWVKANRNYDDLVALVNSRLEENKKPSIIEKYPPWEDLPDITGEEEYLVVFDDQPNDPEKIWGPLQWSSRNINYGLKYRGFENLSVPDEMTIFRKGLYPVNEPLVISDRVKIYRVDYADQPEFDEVFEYKEDLSWVTETGRAVGTYFIHEKTVADIKENFKQLAVEDRNKKMFTPSEMLLNDTVVFTYTDTQTYLVCLNKSQLMGDDETVNFKLATAWITATKDDLITIANFIDSKMQEYYDQEFIYNQQIDACETVDDLRNLYESVAGE